MELVDDLNQQIREQIGFDEEGELKEVSHIEYRMLMQKYGIINPQLNENHDCKFFKCCMMDPEFRYYYGQKPRSRSTSHAMNRLLPTLDVGRVYEFQHDHA